MEEAMLPQSSNLKQKLWRNAAGYLTALSGFFI